MAQEVPLSTPTRIAIGAMAGLVAAIIKFYGAEFHYLFGRNALPNAAILLSTVLVSYAILAIMLAIVGGFVAFLDSNETNKMKLVAVAMAAPATFNSYFSGGFEEPNQNQNNQAYLYQNEKYVKNSSDFPYFNFINSAYAQTTDKTDYSERTRLDDFASGFSYILRIGERKCWIVVGSLETYDKAEEFAKKLDTIDPTLGSFVGIKSRGYYPVLIGGFLPKTEAKELLTRAKEHQTIADQKPFLSGC